MLRNAFTKSLLRKTFTLFTTSILQLKLKTKACVFFLPGTNKSSTANQ